MAIDFTISPELEDSRLRVRVIDCSIQVHATGNLPI